MVTNAKDKTLSHREIKSLFSVLIIQVMTTGNRDFLVSIFFRHRELKALFIFSSHRLTYLLYSSDRLINEINRNNKLLTIKE